jgi:hypothetical protein
MKKILIFALCLLSLSILCCYADVPISLKNGTANYQEILNWSKEKIRWEAKNDFTDKEIQKYLSGFPVLLHDKCDSLEFLFITNTPQCGVINCKQFVFSVAHASSQQPTYRYIGEIIFSAERLFCYKGPKQSHDYLVTSEHETNATDLLNLYQVVNNKLLHRAKIEIDHEKVRENDLFESLWGKEVKESDLLKDFKVE